jgi:hypothetical protein
MDVLIEHAEAPESSEPAILTAIQGLGGGPKQDAVDERFVLVSDGSDLFGDGEDDMEIVYRKNFGRSLLDPLGTSE